MKNGQLSYLVNSLAQFLAIADSEFPHLNSDGLPQHEWLCKTSCARLLGSESVIDYG